MKTKLMVAILVIAVAVTASVMINAAPRVGRGQPPAGGPGIGCPMGMGFAAHLAKIAKELSLTPDQIKQLKQIHEEFMTATKTTREELRGKMKEMVGLLVVDQPDVTAIKTLASEIDKIKAELHDTAIDYIIRGLGVLTTDQRAKLKTMIEKWSSKGFGSGYGMGPGHRMGRGPFGKACPVK